MSATKLPKPTIRPVAEQVYQLSATVNVNSPKGSVDLPPGHLVKVLWASKRWAEVETLYRFAFDHDPGVAREHGTDTLFAEPDKAAKTIRLQFRIPPHALENVT